MFNKTLVKASLHCWLKWFTCVSAFCCLIAPCSDHHQTSVHAIRRTLSLHILEHDQNPVWSSGCFLSLSIQQNVYPCDASLLDIIMERIGCPDWCSCFQWWRQWLVFPLELAPILSIPLLYWATSNWGQLGSQIPQSISRIIITILCWLELTPYKIFWWWYYGIVFISPISTLLVTTRACIAVTSPILAHALDAGNAAWWIAELQIVIVSN